MTLSERAAAPAAATRDRRVTKSAAAFRTISEVAADLEVPPHVLRFWESKFPQIRPLKRGGGRRYYRPEDVALLRLIRELLYDEGYTIKGVQKLMREGALKQRLAQLEAEQLAEQASPAMEAPGASAVDPLRQQLRTILAELETLRDRLRAALS